MLVIAALDCALETEAKLLFAAEWLVTYVCIQIISEMMNKDKPSVYRNNNGMWCLLTNTREIRLKWVLRKRIGGKELTRKLPKWYEAACWLTKNMNRYIFFRNKNRYIESEYFETCKKKLCSKYFTQKWLVERRLKTYPTSGKLSRNWIATCYFQNNRLIEDQILWFFNYSI